MLTTALLLCSHDQPQVVWPKGWEVEKVKLDATQVTNAMQNNVVCVVAFGWVL